jgi:class 3 adenylate cyclase
MFYREFHYCWEYDLKSEPKDLWPLVADTNRFNRDAGLPHVEAAGSERGAKGRRRLRLFKFGMPVEWEEQPFEWVKPQHFGVVRKYSKGPVAEVRVRAELAPKKDGGTHLSYEIWATPKNAIGMTAIPFQFGVVAARNFAKTFQEYDNVLSTYSQPPLYYKTEAQLSPGGLERLNAVQRKLIEQNAKSEAVEKLVQMLSEGDDLTLARIRSHELADYWHLSRRDMLEACLLATRNGLLDLQWDIVCPHCRGAIESGKSLKELGASSFCESCDIDFNVNFDRSVELTFSPNAAVRHVERQMFCIGGPQVTPHIVAQQSLKSNEERVLSLPLETGRYRLRTPHLEGGQFFEVCDEGESSITIEASKEGWSSEETKLNANPELKLTNKTNEEQLFIFERMKWSDQAATAAEVTALQMFRDLFSQEALRPGELISVGTLTILFTDLRGSTKLYRDIGDAPAFGRVMRHFDILRQCISEEDGALVKTIGDAVMAVFRRPAAAIRAIFKAQEQLVHPPDGSLPLFLKVGIHTGPAITVTLNERLDYFGGTVNMAARLEGLSSGEDVVISSAVYRDPEVAAMLEEGFIAESFEMKLKGFDEESFELWRVKYM